MNNGLPSQVVPASRASDIDVDGTRSLREAENARLRTGETISKRRVAEIIVETPGLDPAQALKLLDALAQDGIGLIDLGPGVFRVHF